MRRSVASFIVVSAIAGVIGDVAFQSIESAVSPGPVRDFVLILIWPLVIVCGTISFVAWMRRPLTLSESEAAALQQKAHDLEADVAARTQTPQDEPSPRDQAILTLVRLDLEARGLKMGLSNVSSSPQLSHRRYGSPVHVEQAIGDWIARVESAITDKNLAHPFTGPMTQMIEAVYSGTETGRTRITREAAWRLKLWRDALADVLADELGLPRQSSSAAISSQDQT